VFGSKEQQDGYDLVEWIAKQPWCNGNVGMLGMSYFGMIQLLVAAQRPPHLKAIFPVDAATDMYRHWGYHGGILHLSFLATWWDSSLVVNRAAASDIAEGERASIIESLLEDPDVRSHPRLYKTLRWRHKNPHLFDILVHPFDGPYYQERSASARFGQIDIPCHLLSRWSAQYIHLPGAFSAYANINAPKRLMITIPESGVGFNRPWHENHDLVVRWYDHWLKGIDTGIMEEPPITILVQGADRWRHENEWPLARTRWTRFHLGVHNRLKQDAPGWNERPDHFTNAPGLKPGVRVPALRYATEPLAQNTEITGPMALYLYGSLSSDDTNWIVELNDVSPEGAETRVSIGWLKASHRELDPARSKPYKPFHPHTRAVPVQPGRVVEYAIELCDSSYVFKAGHRVQLLVKAQDAPWEGSSYIYRLSNHLASSRETRHTIYHTPEFPSHLLLPVIPAT
jgi:predicted acyl esterase